MMAVGTSYTRSVNRRESHPNAGPATTLPQRRGRLAQPDGKALGNHGSYGEAIDQQRAGVIQQTLAFEDRQDAMSWSQRTQHGSHGRGVGRCDDGTKCIAWAHVPGTTNPP